MKSSKIASFQRIEDEFSGYKLSFAPLKAGYKIQSVYSAYPAPGKGFESWDVKVPISFLDRLANN